MTGTYIKITPKKYTTFFHPRENKNLPKKTNNPPKIYKNVPIVEKTEKTKMTQKNTK